MPRPLISNFLVLENTIAMATCYGEHGFGKDYENISVSGGKDNEPGKYWPFKVAFMVNLKLVFMDYSFFIIW